jgi:Uma2 family endonuclease
VAAVASPARITADEFLDMPESEGAELVDGEIVEVPMGSLSSWLGGQLFGLINAFAIAHRLGWVFPQETGIAVWEEDPHRVRKPDLTFVRRNRLPGGPSEGWLTVVPDLVVEVVSPGDRVGDLERKLQEHREAGIPLIWVIYPATKSAHVMGAKKARAEFGADGVLDGGDILPGFTCELAALFAAAEAQA